VAPAAGVSNLLNESLAPEATIGSPLKKQRASVSELAQDRTAGFPSALGDVIGRAAAEQKANETTPTSSSTAVFGPKDEDDEEL
jgi:hypothetical protein